MDSEGKGETDFFWSLWVVLYSIDYEGQLPTSKIKITCQGMGLLPGLGPKEGRSTLVIATNGRKGRAGEFLKEAKNLKRSSLCYAVEIAALFVFLVRGGLGGTS